MLATLVAPATRSPRHRRGVGPGDDRPGAGVGFHRQHRPGRQPSDRGFIHTHREALLAAEFPTRPGRALAYDDIAIRVLATRDADLAGRFVDDRLGPLLRHADADRLIPTLRLFVDSLGSPTHCD
jgi:hypothetical protein